MGHWSENIYKLSMLGVKQGPGSSELVIMAPQLTKPRKEKRLFSFLTGS